MTSGAKEASKDSMIQASSPWASVYAMSRWIRSTPTSWKEGLYRYSILAMVGLIAYHIAALFTRK